MAKYLYKYHDERGEFSANVEDSNGKTIWSVHYPEYYEDEETGELVEGSTIFDDGFMRNADDIKGLKKYLKDMGSITDSDTLTDDEDDFDEDEDEGEGEDEDDEHSFAEGGKIETKIKKKLSSSFALPLQMAVYVPSTEKASQIISKKDFNNRVDEVENYLSDLFGGFSATSVEGGYLSDNKGLIQEDVVKVTAFSGKDGFEDKFAKLLDRIKSWCNNCGQESMGFEFEGELFYIDKDAKFAKGGRTNKYEIYHDTLSSALEEIEAYAHSGGYEFTEDHYTPDVTNGGIPYGQTARIQRGIHKEGKKKDGVLFVQIYRMDSRKYEINGYPSY